MTEPAPDVTTSEPAPEPAPAAAPDPAAQPVKRKVLGMPIAAAITTAVVLVAAVGVGIYLLVRPTYFEFKGDFELNATVLDVEDGGEYNLCSGTGGYSDIAWGTAVTVYNADGRIVATDALGPGFTVTGRTCYYSFTVKEVPAGEGPYQYEIGRRGKLTISEEDARAGSASSSLGS